MTKSNYYVKKTFRSNGYSLEIIDKKRFNKRLYATLTGGLIGILLGGSLIFGASYLEKNFDPKKDMPAHRLMYVFGGLFSVAGAGGVVSYFRHRKDKRPYSALAEFMF